MWRIGATRGLIKTRTECVICNSTNLVDHYVFKKFPIYVGTTKERQQKHLLQDMHWSKCGDCNQIQLGKLIEESILYAKPHNVALGKNWRLHNDAFVKFVNEECYGNILEIGGGNLHIANKIAALEKVNKYEVLDSNIAKNNSTNEKIIFHEKMFDISSIEEQKYDFIIHSHVLEHLYRPLDDLEQMRRILKPNGRMIFSVPMIDNMLKRGYTNALNFEHTYYLSKEVVKHLLQKTGFMTTRAQTYSSSALEDWCLFAVCAPSAHSDLELEELRAIEDFNTFLNINKEAVATINKQLKRHADSKKFIFGGHIFTQFLLNFGLENDFICVLDNDKNKHNEYLYGTNLLVQSPKVLKEYSVPVVVLRAGIYNNEIKQDIVQNINASTRFLE